MNSACRLCIGHDVQLHHLFESEIIPGWTAADAIWELLRFQVSEGDVYPQFICTECIKKLVDFKLFKQQCEINKETLYYEFARSSEVGVDEDVVGMVCFGNENRSELFLKEEDDEVPIEKDPLDFSDEDIPIKSEIEDIPKDENDVSADGVNDSADQASIQMKNEFEDQPAEDSNEIIVPHSTLIEEMTSNKEIPGSVRLQRSSSSRRSKASHQKMDPPRRHINIRDTATSTLGDNGKGDSIQVDTMSGKKLTEEKDDPGLNFTSTCKEEMPCRSGTERSLSGDDDTALSNQTVSSYTESDDMSSRKQCKICGKKFAQRGSLKMHLVIHSSEKPHRCDHCRKTFSQKGSLKRHLLIHSGKKPYQCNECNKSYSSMSYLKQHMLAHLGIKPFKCEGCGKVFTFDSQLRRHMKTNKSCLGGFSRQTTL